MRCYYEVLQVSENATHDELKKSYRKLALKCHPDKNPGRESEANEEFKEVCNAYSTLSDPQERAFYDRNKESILRAADADGAGKSSDTLDVFKFFSTRCYPGGFSDSRDGFYTVYKSFFEELALKDMKYMKEEDHHIPSFGYSYTFHEDVASFYGYWMSYCTSMPFAWADQIDVRQASCRYVEKKIERENRKHRDQEKKLFNEQIRNLVMFVRKRDPRWKEHLRVLEEKSAASAAKREQVKKRVEEERKQQREQDQQDQGLIKAKREYLQQLRSMERDLRGEGDYSPTGSAANSDEDDASDDEDLSEEEEEEEDELELDCIICCKIFTSERTRELHMKTKKHKNKLAQLLQEQAMEEDENSPATEDEIECETQQTSDQEEDFNDGEDSVQQHLPQTSQNKKDKKKRKQEKKMQKKKNVQQRHLNSDSEEEIPEDSSSNIQDKVEELGCNVDNLTIEHKEELEINVECSNLDGMQVSSCTAEEYDCSKEEEPAEQESHEKRKARLRALKAKDTKNKGKKGNNNSSVRAPAVSKLNNDQNEPVCQICESVFPSKNKLFQHIKETGHAALKDIPNAAKKGKSKRK